MAQDSISTVVSLLDSSFSVSSMSSMMVEAFSESVILKDYVKINIFLKAKYK